MVVEINKLMILNNNFKKNIKSSGQSKRLLAFEKKLFSVKFGYKLNNFLQYIVCSRFSLYKLNVHTLDVLYNVIVFKPKYKILEISYYYCKKLYFSVANLDLYSLRLNTLNIRISTFNSMKK